MALFLRSFCLLGLLSLLAFSPTEARRFQITVSHAEIAPKKAKFMRWDTGFGKMTLPDPYFVLDCGGQRMKSEVVKDSLTPRWDASQDFILQGKERVYLAVYDKDLRSDDLIGRVEIALEDLQRTPILAFGKVLSLHIRVTRLSGTSSTTPPPPRDPPNRDLPPIERPISTRPPEPPQKPPPPPPLRLSEPSGNKARIVALVSKGKFLYEGGSACWTCHGEGGDGKGPTAMALPVKPTNLSKGEFRYGSTLEAVLKILNEGSPNKASGMASYAHLSEEERLALAHYILSLQQK